VRRIAVFCGSSPGNAPHYVELARQVGETLAKRGYGLVYGGGRMGLMGAVADGALEAGGEVIGVIPKALLDAELAHHGCTELEIVDTMHERKSRFTALSDAFITIPGGIGTMEELWEVLSWAQIGYHNKPVSLLNDRGYYDHLLTLYDHLIAEGFVRAQHRGLLIHDTTLDGLLTKLIAHEPPKPLINITAMTP
jgi:uncharacterized protein (TIGR00730 family)